MPAVTQVRDRKTLLALLESVNEGNRAYFTKFGKWDKPHVKVFWMEVDPRFRDSVLRSLQSTSLGRELYEWAATPDRRYWIDAADSRIWQIYTLCSTDDARQDLKSVYDARGADRLWLPEPFLDGVRTSMGFDDRGFGISFKNLLAEGEPPLFSAKFWLSQAGSLAGTSPAKRKFLEAGREAFSLSAVRFGRNVSRDNRSLSGQLYELYHDGHLTVNTCDDTEEMLSLLAGIKSRYEEEIGLLEKAQAHRPDVVEVEFDEVVSQDSLSALVESGTTRLKLWLHEYDRDGDLARFNGVDLHTGDFLHLDAGPDYSYLSAARDACMNMAPRYGTLASRYLSSKSRIFHDGVELFA